MIVRVTPDVTGLDKRFDYSVPASLADTIAVGSIVRVDLKGRRVAGWVVEVDPQDGFDRDALAPLRSITGIGPDRTVVELADWAATRWAGRQRHFLRIASPRRAVVATPASRRSAGRLEPNSPATTELLESGGGLLELPPADDVVAAIHSAIALGPTLVVEPSVTRAALLAARLRRAGVAVALMPDDWAQAIGGVDVVVGTRTAAWAPCAGLAAIVVLDEHDESLQQESSPTWNARDVAIERGARQGVPVVLTSPTPTMTALRWCQSDASRRRPPPDRVRRGWPSIEVIDRSDTEPWKRSLLTSALIQELRDHDRTVVCVSNTKGRARLLACRHCRALAQCERCGSSVELADDDHFHCRRCGTDRPPVCQACGRSSFANVRPGVSRLAEELSAAAGRPAVLVDGDQRELPPTAGVYVGTEAVLHRIERADTVAFLEFDRELLAPRFRAAQHSIALLARAARIVGGERGGGRLQIQTFLPDHPVFAAVTSGDYDVFAVPELERRRDLQLPPFAAYAEVSGAGAEAFVTSIPPDPEIQLVADGDGFVARGPNWSRLGEFLRSGIRPAGARLRIAVDPVR